MSWEDYQDDVALWMKSVVTPHSLVVLLDVPIGAIWGRVLNQLLKRNLKYSKFIEG